MRKREIPHSGPHMLALENALDQLPDPAALTPDQNLRVLAVLDEFSEFILRRQVALHVRVWMDEHRDFLPSHASRKRL